MRFNLTQNPWLPIVWLDGVADEVDLVTVLTQAHRIRRILGQTPPMTAALHRLVLAVMHRAYGPGSTAEWEKLWRAESLPVPTLSADRFELFDDERPFFQCPAVAEVPSSSAAKLVPYRAVGNNTTLFDHTTATDQIRLSPSEAARWLVTLQAYDPGGLKTPYAKEKSSQAAPGNGMGIVLVEGSTLKETLLLNLMPYNVDDEEPRNTNVDDQAVWEADLPRPEPEQRHPKGWTDLLTWQSRRVWLIPRQTSDDTYVDQVVITPGTRLSGDPEDNEWMAAYRRPKISDGRKKGGQTAKPRYGPWRPLHLDEHRGVWRFSQELLLAPPGSAERHWQRPLTLDHVARMVLKGVIPQNAVYTLRVFGQQLDQNRSIVEQVLEETVAAPVALLRADYPVAGPVIGHSVELANNVGTALARMEREHCAQFRAAASSRLGLSYWPRLPEPFDAFLRALAQALTDSASCVRVTNRWANQVRTIADQAAVRWTEGSPRQGRNLEVAGECYGRFTDQLNREVSAYYGSLAGYID